MTILTCSFITFCFSLRYAIMDYKVCHHGLQGMPSWTSRYAIMDFKVCHYGLQGMPSWTSADEFKHLN